MTREESGAIMRKRFKSMLYRQRKMLLVLVLGIVFSVPAWAQDEQQGGGGDLRAAVQNPIGSLISLPFKFTFDNGADNGDANFLNVQPVLPITVGDWNLVNRAIIPFVNSPGGITGSPSSRDEGPEAPFATGSPCAR